MAEIKDKLDGRLEIGPLREKYLRSVHKCPRTHWCAYFAFILFSSNAVLQAYPPLEGDADMSDPFSQAKTADDAVRLATDMFDTRESEESGNKNDAFTFAYKWKDGSDKELLTPGNLQSMCEIEQQVFLVSDYGFESSCDTETSNETCVTTRISSFGGLLPASIAFYFYNGFNASFDFSDCPLLTSAFVDNQRTSFYLAINNINNPLYFYRGFINDENATSLVRSYIELTHPEKDILTEKIFEVEDILVEFFGLKDEFARSKYRMQAVRGDIECFFVSGELIAFEFERLVPSDFQMIGGSFLFVTIWMLIYTRSFFLTSVNMLCIILSVTVAMFVYKLIFQITYFDFIHILAVFLVLGIGADGAFVVIDAWKQSGSILEDEFDRLVYTYKRSVATVFNTSFTTMFAFVVTGITPLVPISTFGIFAALCIGVNFCYTCTIAPTTVLIWGRYFEKKRTVNGEMQKVSDDVMSSSNLEKYVEGNNKCFHHYYVPTVLRFRKIFVALGVVVGIYGCWGITKVSQLTKPEQWLPDDHMLTKYVDVLADEFLAGDEQEYTPITVFWGVEDIERNIWSHYTGVVEKYKDELIFDTKFDPSDYDAQMAMIQLCDTLQNVTCNEEDCLRSTTLILKEEAGYKVKCTMRDFHEWWDAQFSPVIKENTNKTLFLERMVLFRDTVGPKSSIGIIDGELKYFAHQFRLTMPRVVPGPDKVFYESKLLEIVSAYEASAPETARLVDFQSGEFVQLSVENALIATVVRGLAITFPVVFCILVLATKNIILASVSVLSIACIVASVLGTVFAVIGWELGTAESIVSIMIVGLSVDYAVHLGHMYTVAGDEGYETREERFHYAVLTMGPTVLAGGMTTLGAGLFLFGCQITFFVKMGTLLTLTVINSLFFALIFLMSCAALFGPEGNTCDVKFLKGRKPENKSSNDDQLPIL